MVSGTVSTVGRPWLVEHGQWRLPLVLLRAGMYLDQDQMAVLMPVYSTTRRLREVNEA